MCIRDRAFRIYRITKPLNGIVTIYGQHISYDLANVPVLPFSTEGRSPQLILDVYKRQVKTRQVKDSEGFTHSEDEVLASVRVYREGRHGSHEYSHYGKFLPILPNAYLRLPSDNVHGLL